MTALKFIETRETIEVQAPSPGLEWEYPDQFFVSGKKPELIIPKVYETIELARKAFFNSLLHSNPDINAGKQFAYMMLKDLKEDNTTLWESFGITIAGAGSRVGVWDLFTVHLRDTPPSSIAATGDATEAEDLGLLVIFCSMYRMGATTDQSYQSEMSKRIDSQAVGLPDEIPKPDALVNLTGAWLTDINYLKMMAGIDMFLNRFPKSVYAKARVGTIISRYRDCASLLSIRFFLHAIGSDTVEDAPAWISYKPIAKDLVRMCKTGQEAAVGSSYFPYQADLGIVRKSAYSTIINPSYFFFVHGVGALLGLERSRNARMTLEYGVAGTVANVFWVAYVHKRNHVQTMQFTVSGQPILCEGESQDTEVDQLTIRSNDPVKWARFLGERDWVLTEFMRETIKKMQHELIETDLRPGTIGEFLARHSID